MSNKNYSNPLKQPEIENLEMCEQIAHLSLENNEKNGLKWL